MAWIAVNKDGTEIITQRKPIRYCLLTTKNIKGKIVPYFPNLFSIDKVKKENPELLSFWICYKGISEDWTPIDREEITLPKGSIKKLIGRELTWEDEPIYI